MDVEKLWPDEILVELEVRQIEVTGAQGVTPEVKQILVERLQEEREDPLCAPDNAHEAAVRSPQREAETCFKKLQEIKNFLVSEERLKEPPEEVLGILKTKLIHLRGRFSRSAGSPTFNSVTVGLLKNWKSLNELTASLKSKKLTLEQVREEATRLVLSITKQRPLREESITRQRSGLDQGDQGLNDIDVHSIQPGGSQQTIKRQEVTELEKDFEDKLNEFNLEDVGTGGCSTKAKVASPANDERSYFARTSTVLQGESRIRQEVSTWKIRFTGTRSDLTIERFLSRIEWHAWRVQIPLDELVGLLDLCLEGEALEWFWTIIDRIPDTTWKELIQEMLLRFGTSNTGEDVRKTSEKLSHSWA